MKKTAYISAALVVGTIFANIGISAFAVDNPPGAVASNMASEAQDSGIHDRVETLLRTDPGLVGCKFELETRAGIVVLGGTTTDEQALRRALELASSVKGVKEVRNKMVVDSPK
jgi:hyperosmotically inducible periplasmic protein